LQTTKLSLNPRFKERIGSLISVVKHDTNAVKNGEHSFYLERQQPT